YIFRTHDYGKTWSKVVTGIRPTDFVHVVREDPARRGVLYAGTEHGFYVSFDDGERWEPLSLNLPNTQVSDIWVEGNSIAISTMGRGFYVLDDVGPIRESSPQITSAPDAYLFKPAEAIRGAGGATISYLLKKPAQSLTLDILDSTGSVVRTYAGGTGGGRGGRGRGDAAVGQPPAGQPPAAAGGGTPAEQAGRRTPPGGEAGGGGGMRKGRWAADSTGSRGIFSTPARRRSPA